MSCGNHIQASETLKSAYFNMSGFALPNFRQGNLGHPGLSMHASDPCDEEIQNHPKKISYHHNVTPSMIDFLFRHKGSVSRQSRPILSGITLPHPTVADCQVPNMVFLVMYISTTVFPIPPFFPRLKSGGIGGSTVVT